MELNELHFNNCENSIGGIKHIFMRNNEKEDIFILNYSATENNFISPVDVKVIDCTSKTDIKPEFKIIQTKEKRVYELILRFGRLSETLITYNQSFFNDHLIIDILPNDSDSHYTMNNPKLTIEYDFGQCKADGKHTVYNFTYEEPNL